MTSSPILPEHTVAVCCARCVFVVCCVCLRVAVCRGVFSRARGSVCCVRPIVPGRGLCRHCGTPPSPEAFMSAAAISGGLVLINIGGTPKQVSY